MNKFLDNNGVSHLIEKLKESGGNIIELTQEEYDSLPDTKYSDGVLYIIKNESAFPTAREVSFDGKKCGIKAKNIQEAVEEIISIPPQLLDMIYPVGSIYMSVSSVSPEVLFGGTWISLNGYFLLGSSSTYTVGSFGGEATHTLTTAEMPAHTHSSVVRHSGTDDSNFSGHIANAVAACDTSTVKDTLVTGSTGGSKAHNNMPPYMVVNMWQRTA